MPGIFVIMPDIGRDLPTHRLRGVYMYVLCMYSIFNRQNRFVLIGGFMDKSVKQLTIKHVNHDAN